MKKQILFLCAALASLAVISCSSAPKEKRSLTWNSTQLNTVEKAKKLAENWDFKVIRDGVLEESRDKEYMFLACDEGNRDAVIYSEGEGNGYKYGFRYVCTSGQASSTFIVKFPNFMLTLSNTDKKAVLHANKVKMKDPEKEFRALISDRDNAKRFIKNSLGYTCVDKICEEQSAAGGVTEF